MAETSGKIWFVASYHWTRLSYLFKLIVYGSPIQNAIKTYTLQKRAVLYTKKNLSLTAPVKLHTIVHNEKIHIWVKPLCASNCMCGVEILRARVDLNEPFDKKRKQMTQGNFNACQHQLQADSKARWYCTSIYTSVIWKPGPYGAADSGDIAGLKCRDLTSDENSEVPKMCRGLYFPLK